MCTACAAGEVCSAGACVVDPASLWNVIVEDVTVPATNTTGGAWDSFGGPPDPYVEGRVGSDTATPSRTSTTSDVFTVDYTLFGTRSGALLNSNVRADTLRRELRFDVYDDDVGPDNWVGACRVVVDATAFSGSSHELVCAEDIGTGNAGFTLHWHLEAP